MLTDPSAVRAAVEAGRLSPGEAVRTLAAITRDAQLRRTRVAAWQVLGELAGRALDTRWEDAERAAFVLLDAARRAQARADRVAVLEAIGRAFRNAWFLPYVHARLGDDDPEIAGAAISAAGGLAFPGLEQRLVAGFLADSVPHRLRREAVAALGRMGAETATARLVAVGTDDDRLTAAVLDALAEIRAPSGAEFALGVLGGGTTNAATLAAVGYLAAIGRGEVAPWIRRLSRDASAESRLAAQRAERVLASERSADATERLLSALGEPDRAARARLARRLRVLPEADVLENAELLLGDDPQGVVQLVSELRTGNATRFLVRVAERPDLATSIRAQAAGAVEANEAWERDELVRLALGPEHVEIRAAAARTFGAFASPAEVLDRLAPLSAHAAPTLRGAVLWALQLSAPGAGLQGKERAAGAALLRAGLRDPDAGVRRRAAYVAGNLGAEELVPDLVAMARTEEDGASERIAAYVGLGEVASADRFGDLLQLFQREQAPEALDAVARAIERAALAHPDPARTTAPLADRVRKLLGSGDAATRGAAARLSGLSGGAVGASAVAPLLADPAVEVREQAVVALGRIGGPEAPARLQGALTDVDPSLRERAAEALIACGTEAALAAVVAHVTGDEDREGAARIARGLRVPEAAGPGLLPALRAARGKLAQDDPAAEVLLGLEVDLTPAVGHPDAGSPDDAIAAAFPPFPRLAAQRSFEPIARSLRTAELLCRAAAGGDRTDLSAAVLLWAKALEGFAHATLGPRLAAAQRRPADLIEVIDRQLGPAFSTYATWLAPRWPDPVTVGSLTVELALRSTPNALRELSERGLRRQEVPPSITEWARLILFLGHDHPAGPRNLLGLSLRDSERAARLAHRLLLLAQVRNLAAHRSTVDASTLRAFRDAYYPTFTDLVAAAL